MLKLLLFLSIFILSGCTFNAKDEIQAQKYAKQKERNYQLQDLLDIPQDSSFYLKESRLNPLLNNDYFKKYYRVWNIDKPSASLHDIMWPFRSFTPQNSYGLNLKAIDASFFEEMKKCSNLDAYATLNKRAISLDHLDLRVFPTQKPLFKDPTKAGEGFPFDYLQNSTVFANEPLLVSHYSENNEWAFVESSFAFGWVKSKDIKILTENETKKIEQSKHAFLLQDQMPIFDSDTNFLYNGRIGMSFAIVEESAEHYKVYLPRKEKALDQSYLLLKKSVAQKGFLSFTPSNIIKILDQIKKSKYGWGGMYGEKDCSSTLRDFYAPFGLWLARNSSVQSQQGVKISLKGKSSQEKLNLIKQYALPFQTLLYKPGHIVMFVGTYKDQIVVFQNVWGVKTEEEEKEGRFVVGKALFSTLKLGEELEFYDAKSSLLNTITSMNLLKR